MPGDVSSTKIDEATDSLNTRAFYLLLLYVSVIGGSSLEAMAPILVISGLVFIYCMLPGTKQAFGIPAWCGDGIPGQILFSTVRSGSPDWMHLRSAVRRIT